MATDFWSSSHYKRWIVDRISVKLSKTLDLKYVSDPSHLDLLAIFFANRQLGKKLQLRQRVIATATVFFRRFYLKNSYCETDPFLVVAACCYLASKAEESPLNIKHVVSESRALFSHESYGLEAFPLDNARLAEMEFHLVDELECDLTVFHPYRTLLTLCRKQGTCLQPDLETEAGEVVPESDAQIIVPQSSDEEPRYWGSGKGQLVLQEGGLQMAWFIINDTYRSDLCLLYPPHLIAIAAIYLTLTFHVPTRDSILSAPPPSTSKPPKTSPDPITFLASLNVSLPLIATISQEIISLYKLWARYKEDLPASGVGGTPAVAGKKRKASALRCDGDGNGSGSANGNGNGNGHSKGSSAGESQVGSPPSTVAAMTVEEADETTDLVGLFDGVITATDKPEDSHARAKAEEGGGGLAHAFGDVEEGGDGGADEVVTASFLCRLLLRMREARLSDPSVGHPLVMKRT